MLKSVENQKKSVIGLILWGKNDRWLLKSLISTKDDVNQSAGSGKKKRIPPLTEHFFDLLKL